MYFTNIIKRFGPTGTLENKSDETPVKVSLNVQVKSKNSLDPLTVLDNLKRNKSMVLTRGKGCFFH